jgi:hypothetical protein
MKRFLFALAGILAVLAVPVPGQARVEADPNREYIITPEAGPFAICVHAYSGPDAHALANRLVLHLRQNGWPAYIFDYTPERERNAREWLDARYQNAPPEVRREKTIRVDPQFGVFIGGYRDFESASGDIAKVKQTPEFKDDSVDWVEQTTGQLYRLGTYAQCIATRNPTVRAQKPAAGAPDPSWKNLNAGRPYNLLECGKPWTLAVKQFQGTGVVQPRSAASQFLNMIGLGGKSGDMLEASAAQAEEVARFLRVMKIDAYVLHTRTGSIVTVGAFDRQDDPRMQDFSKKLAGFRFGQTADSIQLFAQPLPMQVPQL